MTNQPTRTKTKIKPDIQNAAKVYRWLWLSPFLTVPTLIIIYLFSWSNLLAIFSSALWHLVLLRPAFNKKSEFVRWHGRQALLLAGARTLVAIPAIESIDYGGGFRYLLILIAIWLFATSWGQGQAKRGECALMRWTGRGAHLPLPVSEEIKDATPQVPIQPKTTVDQLVDVIRFNPDPQLRSTALAKLKELGYVEPL